MRVEEVRMIEGLWWEAVFPDTLLRHTVARGPASPFEAFDEFGDKEGLRATYLDNGHQKRRS